jgi:hypothetical protein
VRNAGGSRWPPRLRLLAPAGNITGPQRQERLASTPSNTHVKPRHCLVMLLAGFYVRKRRLRRCRVFRRARKAVEKRGHSIPVYGLQRTIRSVSPTRGNSFVGQPGHLLGEHHAGRTSLKMTAFSVDGAADAGVSPVRAKAAHRTPVATTPDDRLHAKGARPSSPRFRAPPSGTPSLDALFN